MGVLLAGGSAAPPAVAADATVQVSNFAFSPKTVSVALGDTVTWEFPDSTAHTTTSNQGFWDSGSKSGGASFVRTFGSAGTYAYDCDFHPSMTGKVRVPLKATALQSRGWTLRWATGAAADNRDYDVQVRRSGTTTWRSFRSNTDKATGAFTPSATGTWQFRARTSNTDAGKSSAWSPVKAVAIS